LREEEGLIVPLPDRTQYGFVALIRDRNSMSTVIVTIWDVRNKSTQRLGEVEAVVAGPITVSDTTPLFVIRILAVIAAT
jgi:hypothetical protein